MTDSEFVTKLSKLYQVVLSLRKDEDFEVNQDQMDKLVQLYRFFLDRADELDGKVEQLRLVPKEEHSGVTATFLVFDIVGENIQKFCDVMRYCSAISIDTCKDGVCISCTVPNVFVKRTNPMN